MKDYLKDTNFILKTCESEYARDSHIKRNDIRQLMEWVDKQPHMPRVKGKVDYVFRLLLCEEDCSRKGGNFPKVLISKFQEDSQSNCTMKIGEYMLIQFYQASNYSLQKAKNLVESYYRFKNEAPEAFTGLDYDPSRYQHSFWDVTYCLQLPKKTSKGYRVIYCGFRDPDPSKFDVEVSIRMYQKTILTGVMEHGICPGYVFVYDTKGLSMGHFATLTISLVRKYMYYIQELEPFHIREVHILNVHSLMDKLMMFLKPFMKRELYDMIQMHSNINEFFKHFDKDTIPLDIGGDLPYTTDEIQEVTKAQVNALAPFVEEELKLRTDEAKRLKSTNSEKSSINASFKQLIID